MILNYLVGAQPTIVQALSIGGVEAAELLRVVTTPVEMVDSYVEIGAIPAIITAIKKEVQQGAANLHGTYLLVILNFVATENGREALREQNAEQLLTEIAAGTFPLPPLTLSSI